MPQTFTHQRTVEFNETDLAGIVHFSRFFIWAESAEHALFRKLGLSIVTQLEDGSELGWPRVNATIDFASPARFEDTIETQLWIKELRPKAVVYGFKIVKPADGDNPELPLAAGSTTSVCAAFTPSGGMKATSIPQPISELLQPYVY